VRSWERLLAAIIMQEDSRIGHRSGLDQGAAVGRLTRKMFIPAVVETDTAYLVK